VLSSTIIADKAIDADIDGVGTYTEWSEWFREIGVTSAQIHDFLDRLFYLIDEQGDPNGQLNVDELRGFVSEYPIFVLLLIKLITSTNPRLQSLPLPDRYLMEPAMPQMDSLKS